MPFNEQFLDYNGHEFIHYSV